MLGDIEIAVGGQSWPDTEYVTIRIEREGAEYIALVMGEIEHDGGAQNIARSIRSAFQHYGVQS